MNLINPASKDYLSFSQLLTSYRLSIIFKLFEKYQLADCIDNLSPSDRTAERICKLLGWEQNAGNRMLDCFCHLGMLEKKIPTISYQILPLIFCFPVRHTIS